MSDREYVKINTSIQTGSNAQNLLEDTEGNVQAEIELRLPDNLFSATNGAKKVDKVELLTTKMRVSMQNTPIAQIPIDTELQTTTYTPSTCQLDVYPFCLIDDGEFYPKTLADTAFPNYRTQAKLSLLYVTPQDADFNLGFSEYTFPVDAKNASEIVGPGDSHPSEEVGKTILALFQGTLKSRPEIQEYFSTSMNMCLPNNHERLTIENGELLIKHISSLSQLWNDALENAMVTALREADNQIGLMIPVIRTIYVDTAEQATANWLIGALDLDTTKTVLLPPTQSSQDEAVPFYISRGNVSNLYNTNTWVPLRSAFKPEVSFGDTSLSIAYDTAPFFKNTPILWNPSLVETGNVPEQLKENPFLSAYTLEPPAKRFYVTPVDQTGESDERGIDANLIFSDSTSKAFNIIGNRATRDTFSFLPWTEIPRTIAPVSPHLSLAEGEPFYLLNAGGTKTERSTRDLYSEGTGEQKVITEQAHVQQISRYIYENVITGENHPLIVRTSTYANPSSFAQMMSNLRYDGIITAQQDTQFSNLVRNASYSSYLRDDQNIGTIVGYYFRVSSTNVDRATMSFDPDNAISIGWSGLRYPAQVINKSFNGVFIISETREPIRIFSYPYETTPNFEFVSETYEPGSGNIQFPNTSFEQQIISRGRQSYVVHGVGIRPAPGGQQIIASPYGMMWTNDRPYETYDWETTTDRPNESAFRWHECVGVPSTFSNAAVVIMPGFAYQQNRIQPQNFNACVHTAIPDGEEGIYDILCIQDIGKHSPATLFGTNTYLWNQTDPQNELNADASIVDSIGGDLFYTSLAVNMVDEINLRRKRASGFFNRVNQSVKVTTTWGNLPIVVMSPIQSFVLTLQGVQVRQEYQPINRVEGNASSLTSSFPVIENYYTLASTLAELHDELVIIKDSFNDQPLYSLPTTAGESRVLKFTLYYITKDGRLHKLFIPKKGIFAIQLTFGITYYYTS